MIVDAHLHVFLSKADDPDRTVDAIAPAERSAPVELLEETMAAHGVDAAVLVPLGPEDGYVSDAVRRHPGRYAGIGVWDGEQDAGKVADRLAATGMRGLRMFGFPAGVPWAVLERLASDGSLLWLYPRPDDVEEVHEVCRRLPDLAVVLNHTGLTQGGIGVDDRLRPRIESDIPQPAEARIRGLAAYPNVSVILSGSYAFSHQPWPYPDLAGVTRRVVEAFGTERVMWASDFPWILDDPGYGRMLELVDQHLPGLSPTERAAVLGGNARRIVWEEE
ncbi:MAG: amidohydrolase family protein [Actinomycetes bacterium]